MVWWKKPDVRRVADKIPLGDYRSVRAYMIAVLGKDVDYSKKPKEHIPWPQQVVHYIRFSSKEQMEPRDEEEKIEKEHATIILNELRRRTKRLKTRTAKDYTIDYVVNVEGYGQRLRDKVKDAKRELDDLDKETRTWHGIGKKVADILGFRGTSGAGGYFLLEGPLGDMEFDIAGVHVRGRDIGWMGFATFFGVASVVSYSWGRKKRHNIYKKLKKKLDEVYREGIADSVELLERYYPETLIDIEPEDEKVIDEAGKMLMKKHLHKNGR